LRAHNRRDGPGHDRDAGRSLDEDVDALRAAGQRLQLGPVIEVW
jgi:hypothetical protein